MVYTLLSCSDEKETFPLLMSVTFSASVNLKQYSIRPKQTAPYQENTPLDQSDAMSDFD